MSTATKKGVTENIISKPCSKCGGVKFAIYKRIDREGYHIRHRICVACRAANNRNYYHRSKANPEKAAARQERKKQWHANHPDYWRNYRKGITMRAAA